MITFDYEYIVFHKKRGISMCMTFNGIIQEKVIRESFKELGKIESFDHCKGFNDTN